MTTPTRPNLREAPPVLELQPPAKKPERKKRSRFITAAATVSMLAGASLLGYIAYDKLTVEPSLVAETQENTVALQEQFNQPEKEPTGETAAAPVVEEEFSLENVPVPARVEQYAPLGILYVPSFGTDYSATVTAGDYSDQISGGPLGVDYYPTAAMPGELGNFTLAGHRGYSGMAKFHNVSNLVPGDLMFFETEEGWYEYEVTGSEIVTPDQVEVLLPVPRQPDATPTQSLMTLTSCYYEGVVKNRIAVYSTLVDFTPRSEGAPAELG